MIDGKEKRRLQYQWNSYGGRLGSARNIGHAIHTHPMATDEQMALAWELDKVINALQLSMQTTKRCVETGETIPAKRPQPKGIE